MSLKYIILVIIVFINGITYSQVNNKVQMKDEYLEGIFIPKLDSEKWMLVKTNIAFYEIKTGIYTKYLVSPEINDYSKLESLKYGEYIFQVWTDEENIILLLKDGSCIVLGFLEITSDGKLMESVIYSNLEDFDEDGVIMQNNPRFRRIN